MKKALQQIYCRISRRFICSFYIQRLISTEWRNIFRERDGRKLLSAPIPDVPERYQLPDKSLHSNNTTPQPAPLFITARFRSGSTFIWQLFRAIPDCTAYYEPLNERQWFLEDAMNGGTDASHLGVADYWQEYSGLYSELKPLFQKDWTFKSLNMDERDSDSRLYAYINTLIKRASGRAVLQFNRVDFRLPWLKAHFPQAKIIHIYRDPREQWLSIMQKCGFVPLDYHCTDESELNIFYTLEWARDLSSVFPFLDPEEAGHPYALHYMLWRLSHAFGNQYADISIAYEDLVNNVTASLETIEQALEIEIPNKEDLAKLNHGEIKTRWRQYAPIDWYRDIEQECERQLQVFFQKNNVRCLHNH